MYISAKKLKLGSIYGKNGYRIYYAGGYFIYSCFEYDKRGKFKTLKELKVHMKNVLK